MNACKKYLSLGIFIAQLAACWGEFVLCFIRGYSELWYTIAVPSLIVSALVVAAFLCKEHYWLYGIATAIVIAGCVLLVGFPAYVMYLGFVLGGASLVAECTLLVIFIVEKRKDRTTKE